MARILVALVLLAGCSPLSSEAQQAMFDAIRDRSACVMIGGGAGSAALVPGPGVPMGGGYGYAWILHAMPEHSATMNSSGCTITNNGTMAVTLPKASSITTFRKNRDGSTTIETQD